MSGLTDEQLRKLLADRDHAELVEWIMDRAAVNEPLGRALIELVAPKADTATLVSELRRIITRAWGRTRTSRQPWKLGHPIAADLEPVLPALEKLIERGEAVAAEKVLRRFVEAADKGFDHIDDSYGYLGPLCKDAVTLWGKAWAGIKPRDLNELATMVFQGLQNDGYGIRDDMIASFGEALGREGLLRLRELFLTQYHANLDDQGMDDWKRREPLQRLAKVADALSDVDMYIEAQRESGLLDVYAMPIARRLLDAGRPGEALEYLDRGDPSRPYFHGERDDYPTLRFKILQSLGRDREARDALWQELRRSLNTSALDRLLALTPSEEQPACIDAAIAVAESYPDRLAAARFLVDRGQANRAAELILAHPDDFDGRYYGIVLPLTEALRDDHPAAAWVLYRSLLLDILEEKRYKSYRHAADYVAIAAGLAERASLHEKHEVLMTDLQTRHGRKSAFWRHVK